MVQQNCKNDPQTRPSIQKPIQCGDLFEMVGRIKTLWTVEKLLKVRNFPARAQMSQVDGLGRLTVNLDDLVSETLFKRIDGAVL